MKSDVIRIDNRENGFSEALEETEKVAVYTGLDARKAMHLNLLAHELLSLAHCINGDMQANFWIEADKGLFDLHMTTQTVMDAEKRKELISAASSSKNDAARGLLGWLRDKVEQKMLGTVDHSEEEVPYELMSDVGNQVFDDPEWDGYERSVLLKLADNVKVGIRGDKVDIDVIKYFGEDGN